MSLSAIFLPFQTLSIFSLYLTSPPFFMHTSSFFFITSRALARRQRCNRQIIINKGTSVAAVYKERDVCTRNFFVSFLNINWREELNSYHREMVATCCIYTQNSSFSRQSDSLKIQLCTASCHKWCINNLKLSSIYSHDFSS